MASHSLLGAPSLPLGQDGGALALGITAVFPKKVPTGGQRGTVPETCVKMVVHDDVGHLLLPEQPTFFVC